MIEKDLNKVLNYMKQYVENKYEHDSEPMLTWKDLILVLNEIERLNNIINELEKWLGIKTSYFRENVYEIGQWNGYVDCKIKLQELKGSDKE